MPTDPWYKNKSTLGHILGVIVGVIASTSTLLVNDFHVSIPAWLSQVGGILLTIAAGIGIADNHS